MCRFGNAPYLFLVASMVTGLFGCAEMILPIPPGTTVVEDSGYGLIFGRVAVIRDGEDQMTSLPGFPKEFGWALTQTGSGKRYVVSPLTQNGIFLLALPAGSYQVSKLMYEERAGLWEGRLPARFSVRPGETTYLGTWEITFTNLGSSSRLVGGVRNQLNAASNDLKETYAGKLPPITLGLLDSDLRGYFSLMRPRAEQ